MNKPLLLPVSIVIAAGILSTSVVGAVKLTSSSLVSYSNGKSGLKAKTVQAAIDEIGIQAKKAIGSNTKVGVSSTSLEPTSWKGVIYDVCENTPRTTNITVTFTPSSATQGTFVSSDYDVFFPDMRCSAEWAYPRGTYSGSYMVVDNVVFSYDRKRDGKTYETTGTTVLVEPKGNTLRILELGMGTGSNPKVLTVLTKQ